jgi:DNA-directed RNA polymerase specialized sigma24 family protein
MTESDHRLLRQEMTLKDRKELSETDLVCECIAGKKVAWEEFFTRFIPVMRDAIVRVLINNSARRNFVDEDDDAVWEIHEKIVIKLYRDGLLTKCTDPSGIRQWLRTVATNTARDWFRKKGRQKNLPEQSAEWGMRSIDAPLFDDSETTLGDIVECESAVTQEEAEYAEAVLHDLNQLADRRNYWILRLSILAVLPMSPEETGDLAEYGQMQSDSVRKQIEQITEKVEDRLEKRKADLGRAVLLYHQLRRLEFRLRLAIEDEPRAGREPIEILLDEIAAKSKRREGLLEKALKLPRPANIDIAELVGMPVGQEGQVTVILDREREKIRKKWAKANQKEDTD